MTYTDDELESFWLEAENNNGCKAIEDDQGRNFVALIEVENDLLRLMSLQFAGPVTPYGVDVSPDAPMRFARSREAPSATWEPWRRAAS